MRGYEIVLCEIKFYEAAAPIEILKQIRKLCIFGPAPLRRVLRIFKAGVRSLRCKIRKTPLYE